MRGTDINETETGFIPATSRNPTLMTRSSCSCPCEAFVLSLVDFGCRRGLLKRTEIVQMFGDIALNDPHLLAEGKPVAQTIRAIGKQLGLLKA